MSPKCPVDTAGEKLPVFARWLLTVVAPPAERRYLLDDLGEEFDARVAANGRTRATVWLISQTVRSLGPLAVTRLHSRRPHSVPVSQGDPVLTQLRDDLRFSLRVALRRPWLSLTIIATMVLGIGTTTAVFSIIDALLLRPLSFPAPEQLVRLASPFRNAPFFAMVVNHADIADLR